MTAKVWKQKLDVAYICCRIYLTDNDSGIEINLPAGAGIVKKLNLNNSDKVELTLRKVKA